VIVAISSRRTPLAIWCIAATFVLAVVGVAFALISAGRTQAVAEHAERVTAAANAAEAEINRTLLGVDVLLAGLPELLRPTELANGDIDHARAQVLLSGAINRGLLLRNIALIANDGSVLAMGQSGSERRGLNLPGGFADEVLRERPPVMLMSPPAQSQATAEPVVYLGRAFRRIDGRRAIVIAEIPVAHLATLLAAGIDLRRTSLTLELGNGRLVTSAPSSSLDGNTLTPPLAGESVDGLVHQSASRTTKKPVLLAIRPTLYRGIFVTASTLMTDVLADWQEDRLTASGVALLFILMVLTTAGVTHWYWARVSRARQAEKDAVAAMRVAMIEKSTFLAATSHELRSPLQSILSNVDTLELRLKETAPEEIRWLQLAARSLERILRDLLTLAQGEAGKLEILPEPFEACDLARDAVDEQRAAARAKGLHLIVDVPDKPIFVVADHSRISQILANLLSNAVKYTDAGEVALRLEPFEGGMLRFHVTDTGPGIPADFIPSLFTPFRRRATVDRGHGSGLGLAIVQALAAHLGAKVTVDSQEGHGTTFHLEVPAAECREEEPAATVGVPRVNRVLIVDDRPEVLKALAALTTQLGYQTDVAESAAIAANLLHSQRYGLVLVDLEMPVKPGKQLASETKRGKGLNHTSRFIAMSASSEGRAVGEQWPFDGFVQKGGLDHRELRQLLARELVLHADEPLA
jgi:signal transduction histidine kinase/CheY-like chemotaxis protein